MTLRAATRDRDRLDFLREVERRTRAGESASDIAEHMEVAERTVTRAREEIAACPLPPPTKTCTGPCGLDLPLDSFSPDKRGLYGRRQRCHACSAKIKADSRRAKAGQPVRAIWARFLSRYGLAVWLPKHPPKKKVCADCGQSKPARGPHCAYQRNRVAKDGLQDTCRTCRSAHSLAKKRALAGLPIDMPPIPPQVSGARGGRKTAQRGGEFYRQIAKLWKGTRGKQKIGPERAKDIRERYGTHDATGRYIGYQYLAEEFGVCVRSIEMIVKRQTYTWVRHRKKRTA